MSLLNVYVKKQSKLVSTGRYWYLVRSLIKELAPIFILVIITAGIIIIITVAVCRVIVSSGTTTG